MYWEIQIVCVSGKTQHFMEVGKNEKESNQGSTTGTSKSVQSGKAKEVVSLLVSIGGLCAAVLDLGKGEPQKGK